MSKKYDVAIIGSGPGGYVAALRLRQLNRSVCVIDIDEEQLGGVCLNEGCIPVKSILYTSNLISSIRKANEFGIEAEVKTIDIKKIFAVARNASSQLRNGLKSLFKRNGIEFIAGRARLLSHNKISISSESGDEISVDADNIIVATGSSPSNPFDIETEGETVITSSQALKLEKVPKSLLIIGAGAAGVEFSSIFSSFGSSITLVEMMPSILPFEDEEISKALERILKKKGIEICVNTRVKSLKKRKKSVETILATGDTEKSADFECVLIATGRRPNTEDIGLEEAGVKLKDGFIETDDRMRTSVKNIYAAGDVLNTPKYAHVAYKEGLMAAEDIAGIKTEPIDYESMPSVVFCDPQVASLGLTEAKAKELKKDIAVSRQFFKANGLAVATGREEGFIKIVADKKTRAILGVHILGQDATEIIHEFVIARNSRLTIDEIAKAVHAHPTFSEIAVDAARSVFGKPIHG